MKTWEQSFFEKFKSGDVTDCWLWTGATSTEGYGVLARQRDGKMTTWKAHRFSWHYHKGDIPEGLLVCHTCDVRNCVNPNHLFLGTPKSNMIDKRRKGRGSRKLSESDVIEILKSDRPLVDLASTFNVSLSTIKSIRNGTIWRHIPRGNTGEWYPMEMAPKDTPILVWIPVYENPVHVVTWFVSDHWCGWVNTYADSIDEDVAEPSHWMPLPKPPEKGS